MPTVSLVIPTHGRSEPLRRLLTSLRDTGITTSTQTEVIVVENGTKAEGTEDTCRSEPGVQYCYEPRPGRSAGLNRGIIESNGEYLAFTDDDTLIIEPKWLELLVRNFTKHENVGYVSGRVVAVSTSSRAANTWERKGGLSKGPSHLIFTRQSFLTGHITGFPLRLIAAGANSMIPRRVLIASGLYDERFGAGAAIPHGESLEICYRVLRAGFTAVYDPEAVIGHYHPADMAALRKKMLIYGIGDTAVHCRIWLELGDSRSLHEALWGRTFTWLQRLAASLRGLYPMPPDLIAYSIVGALAGPYVFLRERGGGAQIPRLSKAGGSS